MRHRQYQIKVVLNGTKPPVWRRLLVSSKTELPDLHSILQMAMGWTDSHLHQFVAGDTRYSLPDPGFDNNAENEAGVRIEKLLSREKQWVTYEYDFGDGWEHRLTLEKILPAGSGEIVPRCIDGRRACPPEDVGGAYGYARFLDAYNDNGHPEHAEMVEWAGENFSPEDFDIVAVNDMLAETYDRA